MGVENKKSLFLSFCSVRSSQDVDTYLVRIKAHKTFAEARAARTLEENKDQFQLLKLNQELNKKLVLWKKKNMLGQ